MAIKMTLTKYPHEYINVPFLVFVASLTILITSVIVPSWWVNTQPIGLIGFCCSTNWYDEFMFAPWYIQILNWVWIKIICLVVMAISVLYQLIPTGEEKTCENCNNYKRKKE